MSDVAPDPIDQVLGQVTVQTPSGAEFLVLTEGERSYYNAAAQKYVDENHLSNISDLQDLDRIVAMETMVWRWTLWLAQDQDYWGGKLNHDVIKKSIESYSKEIRLIKKSLGIDKASRDKDRGDSVAEYLENLRLRAKSFGIMREEQCTKAITLFQELKSQIILHRKCTPEERKEYHCEVDDVFRWIEETAIPEFDKIDDFFRNNAQNGQRYWVRQM